MAVYAVQWFCLVEVLAALALVVWFVWAWRRLNR